MYVWTQKAIDDYAIRHPHVKLDRIPRKVGEEATYDGEKLRSGEIQKAYLKRGLIKEVTAKKRLRIPALRKAKLPPAPKMLTGSDELPRKRPLTIWKDLYGYCSQGYSITETSIRYNMPISEIERFVRANKKKFESDYGEIKFARLRRAS